MKLIQLNVWQGKILIAVGRFLKEQDADIVCLQEVFSSEYFVPIVDNLSTLETLQKDLDYPYFYYEPTYSFTTSGVKASTGIAILSKLPLKDKKVVFTYGDFHHVTDWANDHPENTRNALISTVVLDNSTSFTLVNHHGYRELSPLGSEQSVEAMKKLVSVLKPIDGPIILAGDLNVIAESPAMRLFDNWLEDLTASNKIKDTLTIFGKVRDVPCDHILVSSNVKVNKFEVSEELVSDHKPLILEFNV